MTRNQYDNGEGPYIAHDAHNEPHAISKRIASYALPVFAAFVSAIIVRVGFDYHYRASMPDGCKLLGKPGEVSEPMPGLRVMGRFVLCADFRNSN